MAAIFLLGGDRVVDRRELLAFVTAGNVISTASAIVFGLATYALLSTLLAHLLVPMVAAPVHLLMGARIPPWTRYLGDAGQLALLPVTQALVQWLITILVMLVVLTVLLRSVGSTPARDSSQQSGQL
jgi:large-conductance mechanosensitive channel